MDYTTPFNTDASLTEINLRLRKTIALYLPVLQQTGEPAFSHKPLDDKWSKKEILGHLCDSAFNNIQRFVRGQYQIHPEVSYDQDAWVRLSQYQYRDNEQVILLWKALNDHIVAILSDMNEADGTRVCLTKNTPHTIQWLAHDYVDHLEYHLKQIVES